MNTTVCFQNFNAAAPRQRAALSAPVKGTKPGGILATTTRVTVKVTAIDAENQKATLQFGDGTTRNVAVRPDVDLARRKVGDKVIIRTTEALALTIEKR